MPNIKSAEKRVMIAERNRQRNVSIKSSVKTAIKKVYDSLKENSDETLKTVLDKAYSLIDKAASKGVIHKNTAARKKSRLVKHINKDTKDTAA